METALVLIVSLALWFAVERVAVDPTRNAVPVLAALMILSVLARP
jgi:hypothetical protein